MSGLLDLGDLDFERGAHVLVRRALRSLEVGETLRVVGSAPELGGQLRVWARQLGHGVSAVDSGWDVRVGAADSDRWVGAERAGEPGRPQDHAPRHWGLAARGALVEAGVAPIPYALTGRAEVWSELARSLYLDAAASQWDPETAVPWDAPLTHSEDVEDAVVQVMTFLIENEVAALQVPARFLPTIHPHYIEILQLLAIQQADEARHVEVFSRRARLRRQTLGLSTAGGQASLATLLTEPEFDTASLLLSVLGEGSFLALLAFLRDHAPDPVTEAVARLAVRDEARHVAFGVAHLREAVISDSGLLSRLGAAIERRHDALRHSAGLNAEVFDSLVILGAAGDFSADGIARGYARVQALEHHMATGRTKRLETIGFDSETAERLSALHTRNFM
jgi:hypothetical protein